MNQKGTKNTKKKCVLVLVDLTLFVGPAPSRLWIRQKGSGLFLGNEGVRKTKQQKEI